MSCHSGCSWGDRPGRRIIVATRYIDGSLRLPIALWCSGRVCWHVLAVSAIAGRHWHSFISLIMNICTIINLIASQMTVVIFAGHRSELVCLWNERMEILRVDTTRTIIKTFPSRRHTLPTLTNTSQHALQHLWIFQEIRQLS